jgi:hypothetical protein
MLALAVWTLAGTGCFRATGIQRSPMVAETLPETGGDAVLGLKSKSGAGDYYLGNDFIQIAVDSTVYGDPSRTPLAGAPSGGSIVDAGYVLLNSSYTRVSIPGNAMNRLTPVLNQDPRLQMVFSSYATGNNGNLSSITMTGSIFDPQNILQTGTSAGSPLVAGVTVTHSVSVAQLERFFTLTTTVTNNSGVTLPILNIGDYLAQQGGGYAFNIPAIADYQGNALPAYDPTVPVPQALQWGVQIPASDFTNPIQTSVQAPMVGLMDTEPGADTVDSHCSLGILPSDADQVLVASDPQDLLTVTNSLRPQFPARLVVGSIPPNTTGLANNNSLSYNRLLFIIGGGSAAMNVVNGLTVSVNYPDQAGGLFNLMDTYRYADVNLRPVQDTGFLTFTLSGMSQRQGPMPTAIRIERDLTVVPPTLPAPTDTWQLQRVEYFVPNENIVSRTGLAPSTLLVKLPVGFYRMILTCKNAVPLGADLVQTRTVFSNSNVVASPTGANQVDLAGPIWIQKDQTYAVSSQCILCPAAANDAAGTSNQVGAILNNPFSLHYFLTREANSPVGNLQPLRMTFVRTDTSANPVMMPRMRTLGSYWDPTNDVPEIAAGVIPGQDQFRGGNEMFGAGFTKYLPSQFAWFANGGSYIAYGTRGPLSKLERLPLTAADGQTDTNHVFTIQPWGLPPNWTSFDVPGPGQATTGGYLPSEKLTSALANGVQVVGHTEQDLAVNGSAVYVNYRTEYGSPDLTYNQLPASLSAMNRPPNMQYGFDPFVVGGRTSVLNGYGTATALFTPPSTNAPLGGAQPNQNWVLADFLSQAQGQYNVVNRPRAPLVNPQNDPPGLFTVQGAPTQGSPLAFSSWWSGSGPLSFGGMTNGSFDALELLRGASFDGSSDATATAWFNEFLQVRSDWFGLLNLQSPPTVAHPNAFFTKALGLSSAKFSIDTPVGLARTYLLAQPTTENDLSGVLSALQAGAAVASTGPFLDVSIGTAGPGGTVPGPVQSVTLNINLWKTDWMPVDQVRVVVNGTVVQTIDLVANPGALAQTSSDPRMFSGSVTLPMAQLTGGTDGWVVVEAGVPLATTGIYAAGTPWNLTMRGIYPIAVTNPIFVDVIGKGYTPPGS